MFPHPVATIFNGGRPPRMLPLGFWDVSRFSGGNVTSTIQKAIDAAEANTNGGTVYIPAGDWVWDSQITVPNNVSLVGAGPRATQIIGSDDTVGPVILVGTDTYAASPVHNHVTLANFRIDGTFELGGILVSSIQNAHLCDLDVRVGGDPAPYCIELKNEARYVYVERCDMRGGNRCLEVNDGSRSCRLFLCRFRAVAGTDREGVYVGGTVAGHSNFVLDQCEFSGFASTGFGLHLDGGSVSIDQPRVMLCRFESSQAGTPDAIKTTGNVSRPFGFNNYFGSGSAVNNVNDGSGTWEEQRATSMAPDESYIDNFQPSTFRKVLTGSGTPESNVSGSVGDMYLRSDGGASTTLYVKESGSATTTGWVAK